MKHQLRKIRSLGYRLWYKNPTKGMHVIGVTGTDGKSTTSEMLFQILKASGKRTGIISTIGGKIDDEIFDTGLHTSTPSSKDIYQNLAKMERKGIEYVVLELTSHGLDQFRAHGIFLDAAIITNITPEHLDYHKTFEAYREAKSRIISMVKPKGFLVLNADDLNFTYLIEKAKDIGKQLQIIGFSLDETKKNKDFPIYFARDIKNMEDGYQLHMKLSNISFPLTLHFNGRYNIQNALGAVSVSINLGMSISGIVTGIEKTRNIAGRMNVIQETPFKVIIDFAHTPNAFLQFFSTLTTSYPDKKIIALFGCAGKRDKNKRKPMGEYASQFCDTIVITSEDPRDETFDGIANDILEGIDKIKFQLNKNLFLIPSREVAIAKCISLAKPDTILAFLGKGHEKSMCIGTNELPWNEEEIALQYLHKKESHV